MHDKTPHSLSLADLERAVDDIVEMFQKSVIAVTRTHRDVAQIGSPNRREALRSPLFDDEPLQLWPPPSDESADVPGPE